MASLVAAERAGQPFLKEFFEQSSARMRSSLEFYRHQWQSRYFTEHEGLIADTDGLKRVLANNVYSPTQLEVFCTCPYRFLLAKVFRLEQFRTSRLANSALSPGQRKTDSRNLRAVLPLGAGFGKDSVVVRQLR